tara:strand:- start:201 stop:470 length:270 start_codon:yes stop_codon:yes gene_type:complete
VPSHYAEQEQKIDDKIKEDRERIMKNSESPKAAVTIELPDNMVLKYALQAHERDITLNKMLNIILRDGLSKAEYRFEHDSKPQLLNESK